MNIDKLIFDSVINKPGVSTTLDLGQLRFMMVHALDKKHVHIPEWYKSLRVGRLIDWFITNGVFELSQIAYGFKNENAKGYKKSPHLTKFTINDLPLENLVHISNYLPQEDILEHMKFTPSSPRRSEKDLFTQLYDLTCEVRNVG